MTTETNAQFTERLREKYKDVLARMEREGLTKEEQYFDNLLTKSFDLPPKAVQTTTERVLKELNQQISIFINKR